MRKVAGLICQCPDSGLRLTRRREGGWSVVDHVWGLADMSGAPPHMWVDRDNLVASDHRMVTSEPLAFELSTITDAGAAMAFSAARSAVKAGLGALECACGQAGGVTGYPRPLLGQGACRPPVEKLQRESLLLSRPPGEWLHAIVPIICMAGLDAVHASHFESACADAHVPAPPLPPPSILLELASPLFTPSNVLAGICRSETAKSAGKEGMKVELIRPLPMAFAALLSTLSAAIHGSRLFPIGWTTVLLIRFWKQMRSSGHVTQY
ncbi:hypothetical protein BDK51DRAFT_47522 [Blyttiomyces helicus]|uniref:Uncharacterized protein n=1 Tax=Blyttiomyces helicus TaxID=388810 RepID=A0A4P9WD55_9FUNG|nr:hypothetical protein BDK51DRAFT_47522 [Blyttiomyces helicus]|eukprot:RKO90272.1 hypothetical protein BDK51DRAFT_47522 [Blyttiomyces helicus]